MFVNSVSNRVDFYSRKVSGQNQSVSAPVIKNQGVDTVSFTGINPQVLRNQFKILLTQDIWAVHLKVKMPETPVEKEVLLEILQNRMKLDRYARLTNEKYLLKNKINYVSSLLNENPSHTDLPGLMKEIKNKGNLESYFKTLDKQIELESKKNKPALEYFKNIEKLQEEYLEKRIIKYSVMEKFWHKIIKNDINADKKYSTKELIDIISNGQAPVEAKPVKAVIKPISKDQFLSRVEKQYEDLLRKGVDVYEGRENHHDDRNKSRKIILEANAAIIKRFPGIDKHLSKIFNKVENIFVHKINRLADVNIYPIGEIWKDMKAVETALKKTMEEIAALNKQLNINPESNEIKKSLSIKKKALEGQKKDWIKGLKYSVKYEAENRQRMHAADRLSEYDYLTGENKTIKRHKSAYEIYENNDNRIPDDLWTEVLK